MLAAGAHGGILVERGTASMADMSRLHPLRGFLQHETLAGDAGRQDRLRLPDLGLRLDREIFIRRHILALLAGRRRLRQLGGLSPPQRRIPRTLGTARVLTTHTSLFRTERSLATMAGAVDSHTDGSVHAGDHDPAGRSRAVACGVDSEAIFGQQGVCPGLLGESPAG